MIKKIIAGLCLLVSTVAFSQEHNASPYSFYGLGDVKFKGTAENRSMGGLGILPDSIHVNLQNPATYSALKFTTFTLAATTSSTKLKTADASDKAGRTTIDYLAVALPLGKVGVTFGVMPYTAVGYRIQSTTPPNEPVYGDTLTRSNQFNGDGGINRVFAGASFKITPKFSVGADFQYFFGDITTKSITALPYSGMQYRTQEVNKSSYSGVGVKIGAVYQTLINKKYNWYTSAVYTAQTSLQSDTQREISTIAVSASGTIITNDVLAISLPNKNVAMPSVIAVGTGIGQARKWFVGAEYTTEQTSKLRNRYDDITNAKHENSQKISLGGYYIPKFMSYTSYLSRITYRAGLKYEKTGLVISDEPINDTSLSLGIGLPLSGSIGGSNLNIGLELGKRGTTNAGLVQENYFNLFVGLSLNDKWFVKRKYE